MDKTLREIIIELKRASNAVTFNPILLAFNLDDVADLESQGEKDGFIQEKLKRIRQFVSKAGIEFNPQLKSALDEYSEALVYQRLKRTFFDCERIREGQSSKPDFLVRLSDNNEEQTPIVYVELKTLSFANGNLNYIDTLKQGVDSRTDIEDQMRAGKSVSFGIISVQPLYTDKGSYDPYSTMHAIKTLINKIDQNLKKDQFCLGETVLFISLKQIPLPGNHIESAVPVFIDPQHGSLMSGVLWNVAFGKIGYPMYRPIEFEGQENIEGDLDMNGILVEKDWVKAIVFLDYGLMAREPKIVGLRRHSDRTENVEEFLHGFCDFVNDDLNSSGWEARLNEQ